MAELPGHEELARERVDDPVVGVLIIEERAPEERVFPLPLDAKRARRHMLADADQLRRPADRMRWFGTLKKSRQQLQGLDVDRRSWPGQILGKSGAKLLRPVSYKRHLV